MGKNLYKLNTMKLGFKRKNKEWAGKEGERGSSIFLRVGIANGGHEITLNFNCF